MSARRFSSRLQDPTTGQRLRLSKFSTAWGAPTSTQQMTPSSSLGGFPLRGRHLNRPTREQRRAPSVGRRRVTLRATLPSQREVSVLGSVHLQPCPHGSAFFTAQAFAVPCALSGGASATYGSSGDTATIMAGVPCELVIVARGP